MNSCIFCSIINKKISATLLAETPDVIAINDIAPKAPTHILVIPKLHILNMTSITDENVTIISKMGLMVQELSKKHPQFNLICNNGQDAGQTVMHLHWHFLSGSDFVKKIF